MVVVKNPFNLFKPSPRLRSSPSLAGRPPALSHYPGTTGSRKELGTDGEGVETDGVGERQGRVPADQHPPIVHVGNFN